MVSSASPAMEPEHILCDTSFVSVVEISASRPEVIAHWPEEPRARLDAAVLAITVFVLGELRSGRIRAKWGESKIESAERSVSAYLMVPLDYEVLACYVDLRARYFKQIGDNDLWIAATARARSWPLVACDLDFCLLQDEIELIYLPRRPDSAPSCPEHEG